MSRLAKIYEQLSRVPRWQRWLVILTLGTVLYTFLFFYRVHPLREELAQKKRKMESLSLAVSKLEIAEKRRKTLLEEVCRLKKEIKKFTTFKGNVGQIIRSISGPDSGVIVESITKHAKVSTKYYVKYPYEVILKGTYPSFVKWCEKLSRAKLVLNFGPISMRSVNDKSSNSTVEIKLQIETFVLKE